MPAQKRFKTKYPGVYYIEGKAVGSNGTERIYYIMYRKNGKQVHEKAGRQLQNAMTPARAATIRAARIHGTHPTNKEKRAAIEAEKALQDGRWTINRLWNEYRNAHPDLKGFRTYRSAFKLHVAPTFGDKEPKDILPLDIKRLSNQLLKIRSPQTVQHVLELLRRLINFGANNKLCPGLDFKIEMPRVDNIKTEDLTAEQLKNLLAAIDADPHPHAGPMMKLVLLTGLRKSEMFRLRWEHIDFEKGFLQIVDPKGGPDQTIPLNPEAIEMLEAHRMIAMGSPYVFPGRNGGQRTSVAPQLKRIKEAAGLPSDFRPLHGLRHTFASALASSGQVDMYTLQKLLTHKAPQMTQRYAHLRDSTLKRASNLAGDIIRQAARGSDKEKAANLDGHEK